MELLLKDLEKHFQKNQIFSYLNSGLSISEVNTFFQSKLGNSVKIDTDLIKLYEWRNGINESVFIEDNLYSQDAWLWENRAFLSLEYGWEISKYDKINNIYASSIFTPFSSLIADSLFIDIYDYMKLGYTPINLYCIAPEFAEKDFKVKIYDSLKVMIETILQCFKEEAYYYNTEGELDVNFDKRDKISKKLNPNSEYWFL